MDFIDNRTRAIGAMALDGLNERAKQFQPTLLMI